MVTGYVIRRRSLRRRSEDERLVRPKVALVSRRRRLRRDTSRIATIQQIFYVTPKDALRDPRRGALPFSERPRDHQSQRRRCLIEQERAALEHGAVYGHCDHGADLGHDADEGRLPRVVLPDRGPFAGHAARPNASGAGCPVSAQRIDRNAAQIWAIGERTRTDDVVVDLETGAADADRDGHVSLRAAGSAEQCTACWHGQTLELPVEWSIVRCIRRAIRASPDHQPARVVDARHAREQDGVADRQRAEPALADDRVEQWGRARLRADEHRDVFELWRERGERHFWIGAAE